MIVCAIPCPRCSRRGYHQPRGRIEGRSQGDVDEVFVGESDARPDDVHVVVLRGTARGRQGKEGSEGGLVQCVGHGVVRFHIGPQRLLVDSPGLVVGQGHLAESKQNLTSKSF